MSTFKYEKGKQYFQPITFGPCVSPRQDQYGKRFSTENPIRQESFNVVYECDINQLEAIVPPGFTVTAPYLTVQYHLLRDVYWLAGKGYDLLTVTIPVRYDGERDHYCGNYNTVMWEGHADPLVTGRDQIAMNKLVAELQGGEESPNLYHFTASNWGFTFADIIVNMNEQPENLEELQKVMSLPSHGMFNYRYIPDIDNPDRPIIECAVLTPQVINDEISWNPPADYDPAKIPASQIEFCRGEVIWHKPTWEQMPVQWRIPETYAGIKAKRYIGAYHMKFYNPNDFLYTKTLR